jgi:hypothetical protein
VLRMTETGGRSPHGTVERTVARTTRSVREWQPGGPVAGRRRFGVVPHVPAATSSRRGHGRPFSRTFERSPKRRLSASLLAPVSNRNHGKNPTAEHSAPRPTTADEVFSRPATELPDAERGHALNHQGSMRAVRVNIGHRGRLFRCQGFVAGCLGTELR